MKSAFYTHGIHFLAQGWSKIRQSDASGFYLLGAVFLIILMLWGFIELADAVLEGETQQTDAKLLSWLRHDADTPIGPHWLLTAARDLTALGGYTVLSLFTLVVAGYALLVRRWGAALLVLAASGGGMVLSTLLKWLFARERPDVVTHLVEVSTLSFPSGHAMLSATIYLSIAAVAAQLTHHHRRKLYIVTVALLLTAGIGLSRVYLGVHYPSDVLAGWAVGLAWALLCWLCAVFIQRRHARG